MKFKAEMNDYRNCLSAQKGHINLATTGLRKLKRIILKHCTDFEANIWEMNKTPPIYDDGSLNSGLYHKTSFEESKTA